MTLQSMTGFARVEANDDLASWVWELRSVNGKSLDLRFRLPNGFESYESSLRDFATSHLKRGNVQISLNIERNFGAVIPTLNEANFDVAVKLAKQAAERSGLQPSSLDSLLALKGVVELIEPVESETVSKVRNEKIYKCFQEAVLSLTAAREAEGAALAKVLLNQVEKIETLKGKIEQDKSRSADAIRGRLCEQVLKLLEQAETIDPQRLHQEAAFLATKSDLREELDRLDAHVSSARKLLSSSEPIGRKLDFLSQEFNRECNTICSKSNASAVTNAGLEMKVVIDQFREQVQNIQ